MTQATSRRKRVYREIPANWATMTDEQQGQVAEAIAEEMQRSLGMTDKSEQSDQPANSPTGSEQP